MHTMFTKHRSSNAGAQSDAAATIAANMANNCINTLEGSNIIHNSSLPILANSIASNPIVSLYDVGKIGGSAGPELAWRLFDGKRKSDGKEVTIWFFDRKWVEKKSAKRVDFIIERLKRGAINLDRCRHAKMVTVYNQLIETNDTLAFFVEKTKRKSKIAEMCKTGYKVFFRNAFVTEPIFGSLANITGYLEDRLRQGVPSNLREFTFNDFEIKYGLLQIAEALVFIHHICKGIHGNICPQSIIITGNMVWKLAGLEFLDKNEEDPTLPVNTISFTSKFPKMSQIDLDFSGSNACSQQSDMFAFGLLICSIFNNGRSPIQANLNIATYLKQLETLNANVQEIAERMPPPLAQHLSLRNNSASLCNPASSKRLTSSQFVKISYFEDTGVKALQCLDIIYLKDNTYKATFYQNLRNVMDRIPKKLWFQHILPHLANEFQNAEVSAAALEPILQFCTLDEYQNHIFPLIQKIQSFPRSVQATVTLLENINILKQKTGERHIKNEILPMLISGIQSPVHQIQCAALKAFSEVIDHIDEKTIREIVLPKAQGLLKSNESNVQLQHIVLLLVDRLVGNLEKSELLDEILPFLINSKLTDPIILRPTLHIYQQLLNNKLVGLNVTILATQVMPSLTPSLVCANLTINDFNKLADLLQVMLNIINKSQRNKLKLERMSSYSIEQQNYQNNFDQPIGYPHRPHRLQTRRQSISVDNVQRPSISSNCSSPEINYLRVTCNLPYRRHSDNMIEAPRILINHANNSNSSVHINSNYNYQSNTSINANLSAGLNSNAMPKRRHSAVGITNQNETKSNVSTNVYNFINQARNFTKNSVTGSGSALNNLLNSSQNRRYSTDRRRYSAQSIFNQSPAGSSNFLNQIGSNVQNLFSKY